MICDFTGEEALPGSCKDCSFYIPAHVEKIQIDLNDFDEILIEEDCAR